MSVSRLIYCVIPNGTPAADRLAEVDKQLKLSVKAAFALCRDLGLPEGVEVASVGGFYIGVTASPLSLLKDWLAQKPDRGDVWHFTKRHWNIMQPRRAGAGLGIAKRFEALPKRPSGHVVEDMLGIPCEMIIEHCDGGLKIVGCTLERLRGRLPIVGIPWVVWKKHGPKLIEEQGVRRVDHEGVYMWQDEDEERKERAKKRAEKRRAKSTGEEDLLT